jgi:hypothetical protein
MSIRTLLSFFGPNEENSAIIIKLEGPFISESYVVKHSKRYKKDLLKIAKCNLTVCRDLLITTTDTDYLCRDNSRIELGLNHHLHNVEMHYTAENNFSILAIDNFILLNPEDISILEKYLSTFPPTVQETNYLL